MLIAAILLALTLGLFFAFSMSLITFIASALVYKKCKLAAKEVVVKALGDAVLALITGFILTMAAAVGIYFVQR